MGNLVLMQAGSDPSAPETPSIYSRFDTEAALAAFGARIAAALCVGDAICLFGPLGAGKSTLARGLVRALLADPAAEVPSPTFTLVQSYAATSLCVSHFDLYRLKRPEEAVELGLDEALETGVAVIEWSERLGDALPPDRLEVRLSAAPPAGVDPADARWAQVLGTGSWTDARMARLQP